MTSRLLRGVRAALSLSVLLAAYLVVSETLHLSRRNPFFVADLGSAILGVLAYYALLAVAVAVLVGVPIRSPRAQAFTISAIGYALISLKIFWIDAGLLTSPGVAVAFVLFTCGWFVAAIYVARRLSLQQTFPILLTVAYANVCLAIASGWALGGGRLLPFLLSTRTIAIVLAGVVGLLATTYVQRKLERKAARRWHALVPTGVLLGLVAATLLNMRRLPSAKGAGATADVGAPDIYILSFDALRSDMLQTFIASHPNSNLARVAEQSIVLENVVSHGLSTDTIMANNTFAGARWTDCSRSVPRQLAARGYFTAMLYGASGKRFEGSDCYEYYFSGNRNVLRGRYAVPALGRMLARDQHALRHGALNANEIIDQLRRLKGVGAPLYTYMHFLELHAPYLPKAELGDREFEARMAEYMRRCYTVACDQRDTDNAKLVAFARDAYVSLLEEVDRAVGDVLEVAKQRRRELVIVVTADHGELLGEHGGFAHAGGFVPELLDIPFVVMDSRSAIALRRCELLLSSDAMRSTVLGIGHPDRMVYADRDPLELELPPLGHAKVHKSSSTIDYEVSSDVMPQAGTWRNIHRERRGTLFYPIEHCHAVKSTGAIEPSAPTPSRLPDPSPRHL